MKQLSFIEDMQTQSPITLLDCPKRAYRCERTHSVQCLPSLLQE